MTEESVSQLLHTGETFLNPIGLAATILLGLAMLLLPRRFALYSMILMACFVSQAQRLTIFSMNFDLMRVLVVVGFVRTVVRREWRSFRVKPLDCWLVGWALSALAIMGVLYADAAVFKFKLGETFDAIGMYLLFRVLVRDWGDVESITIGFIAASVLVAGAFLVEHSTGHNMFAYFGGVSEITVVRDGRLRCQGAFSHPILAGCFWAVLMPLMAALWWRGRVRRMLGVLGLTMACVIVFTCASSTPVAAVGIGVVGMSLFPLRPYMRLIRWGGLLTLVILHVIMNAPVWHLLAGIDLVGGSSSWYRYHIIDLAVNHLDQWWFMGRRGYMAGWEDGLWDVTNQYLMEAFEGGILVLGLFIMLFAVGFRDIGRMMEAERWDQAKCRTMWALGTALLVHCVNFISVSYFGQIIMLWYLVLAIIGSLAPSGSPALRSRQTTPDGRHLGNNRFARRVASGVQARSQSGGVMRFR